MSIAPKMTRPPARRMQVIVAALRAGRVVNATEFARQLETSTKTIHRDIDFLRDQLGFEINYDGAQFGYVGGGGNRCPFCRPDEDVLSIYYFPRRVLSSGQFTSLKRLKAEFEGGADA